MMDIWIDALENYLGSSDWQQSIEMFVEANKSSFRFSRQEHHHNHYRIWKIVEQILDVALDKIGGNIQSLEKALDEIASYSLKQKKKQEWSEVFSKLTTYQSFEDFSDMMRQAAASSTAATSTTNAVVIPGRRINNTMKGSKSHSVDDDNDDDNSEEYENYQQRIPNRYYSNDIEDSSDDTSREKLQSDLQKLGFPTDLIEICLESCDDRVTLEDLVVMLSEMTTPASRNTSGTTNTFHSTSFTSTSTSINNRETRQYQTPNSHKTTSPSSQADRKSTSVDISIDCLKALSVAILANQTTTGKGSNSNSSNSSRSSKNDFPVMDAERLQSIVSAAESILATVNSDDSTEMDDDTLELIQWAVAMVEFWEEALLAYQEGLPFHESRRGHPEGLLVWITQLERDRVKAEESSALGRLLSNSELEKLTALNYIVDSMGSEDEKRLHALIVRNEQSQKELSKLHNRVSLVLQAESGPGESQSQRLKRREEVEELYLFLKEQLSSCTNPETATSSTVALIRGREQALQSCARGGALVTLLLELHLLEDEMIFLRKSIQEELSQQSKESIKSDVSEKSPDSGFNLLALAFENNNSSVSNYSNIPNIAEDKYDTTNLEVDEKNKVTNQLHNDDSKQTVTLPTLEDLLDEMLAGMDTHPIEQNPLLKRRESGVTAEDLYALNIGKELLANALNANYSASVVSPVEEEESIVRAVANAIMNRHDQSHRNLQTSLTAKKIQSDNKLRKQLESRKKKRDEKLSQLSDNDDVDAKLDAEDGISTQDRISEKVDNESTISLRHTLYALSGVVLPSKLKLTVENKNMDNKDENVVASSNGSLAALTTTGINLSMIISEFDNIGRALVNAYRYNKDNIVNSNSNEYYRKSIEINEDSKNIEEKVSVNDGEDEESDSSISIQEFLEQNKDIESYLLRVTSESFVGWLNMSAHNISNHSNQLNKLDDITNYENMRAFIKKQFLMNNVKLEYLLDEAHHRSNISLIKRKPNKEAILQIIDSSLETVLNLEVDSSHGVPLAVDHNEESKSIIIVTDCNLSADSKEVDKVEVTSTSTPPTEKGTEFILDNEIRNDSTICHIPSDNKEIQHDVISTTTTNPPNIPENDSGEKLEENTSSNDHSEDTRRASHSSTIQSPARRQAPLLPGLLPPSYSSLFGNNANADAGKLVKEHQEKLKQLEDGLRAQMLERQKMLQKRLHKKKQVSDTTDNKSEITDDSDDLFDKLIYDNYLDDDRLEHLLKQAMEKVITMIRSEIDHKKVLELDHMTLVRAVEQLLMSSSNSSGSFQDNSMPLPSYPYSRSSVAELLSLARAKEAEELRAHARRISTQYTEEQQRHDLNLKVQQARQKQLLQRKLLERNSTTESKKPYGNAMKDVMTVKLPSMSAFNTGINISGLASRGMNLTPMQRRK